MSKGVRRIHINVGFLFHKAKWRRFCLLLRLSRQLDIAPDEGVQVDLDEAVEDLVADLIFSSLRPGRASVAEEIVMK